MSLIKCPVKKHGNFELLNSRFVDIDQVYCHHYHDADQSYVNDKFYIKEYSVIQATSFFYPVSSKHNYVYYIAS